MSVIARDKVPKQSLQLVNWRIGKLARCKKILINFFTSCLKAFQFGNNINRKENNNFYEKLRKSKCPKEQEAKFWI
jgi:hypothetical protein